MTAVGSKCKVCKGPAVIDLPRHNAHFCAEHLQQLCRRQMAKAIDDFDMLQPDRSDPRRGQRRQGFPRGVGHAGRGAATRPTGCTSVSGSASTPTRAAATSSGSPPSAA